MIGRHPVLFVFLLLLGLGLFTCLGGPLALWVLGGGTPNVSVDYVAKLNENAAAVPETDRAWPLYLDALKKLPTAARDPNETELIGAVEPGDARWDEVRAIIASRAEGISLLREAAAKPGLGFIVSHDPPTALMEATGDTWDPPTPHASGELNLLVNVFLPNLSEFRGMARILAADAKIAAEAGEGGRVVDDLEAMHGLARHSAEHPTLINQLVAVAIRTLAAETLVDIIDGSPGALGEAELARADALLARLDGGEPFRLDMSGERYFFLDVVQRIYTDDGSGDGYICGTGMKTLGALDRGYGQTGASTAVSRIGAGLARLVSSSRAEVVAVHDRLFETAEAWAAEPAWSREEIGTNAEWAAIERAQSFPPDAGMVLLGIMVPALQRAMTTADALNAEEDAALVVIALERYRLTHGAWPERLGDLTPAFLGSVPPDLFDGTPLKYAVRGDRAVLYSVGTDRDDDGGRAVSIADRWATPETGREWASSRPERFDGDWVFFPPPVFED